MTQDTRPFILLVDACDPTRESLIVAFEAKGYICLGAVDGESAMDLVREGPCPIVALVDYHLPKASGAETTRCLKTLCPTMPLIGTSTEHSHCEEMIEAGAADFFAKPFDLTSLFETVSLEAGFTPPKPA